MLARATVVAVIGPSTTAGARAAAPLYAAASMPVVLVSAADDAAGLSATTLRTLCVTRASDSSRTLPILFYLTRTRPSRRTAIVQDGAAGEAAVDISRNLVETPPDGGTVTVHQVAPATSDFGPAVARALATSASGGLRRHVTAPCGGLRPGLGRGPVRGGGDRLRARHARRLPRGGGAGGRGVGLRSAVHRSAVGRHPGREGVHRGLRARFGGPPGRWSAEAYDAVGLVARALDALGTTTAIEPAQVAERLFHTAYDGVAKPIRFVPGTTHALDPENTGFLYQVRDGAFRFLGRYDQVSAGRP